MKGSTEGMIFCWGAGAVSTATPGPRMAPSRFRLGPGAGAGPKRGAGAGARPPSTSDSSGFGSTKGGSGVALWPLTAVPGGLARGAMAGTLTGGTAACTHWYGYAESLGLGSSG